MRAIVQNYIASNFFADIPLIVFVIGWLVVFLPQIEDITYFNGSLAIFLFIVLVGKISFAFVKIRSIQQKIYDSEAKLPMTGTIEDFYKLFKVRISLKEKRFFIREQLYKPISIDLDEVNKKSSKIVVIKNEWWNFNLKYMGWNSYFQILLINDSSIIELLRLKNIGLEYEEDKFPFEQFKALGNRIAEMLDLKISYVVYDRKTN